tara:strand:+ start:7456 stop:9522 length:2067 start_codon:yes stop_codon:yes gene_type:complete
MSAAAEQHAGMAILVALQTQLAAAEKAGRPAIWETLQTPDALDLLAGAWQEDPDAVSSRIAAIGMIPGCTARSRSLSNTIRRLAEDQTRRDAQRQAQANASQLAQSDPLSQCIDVPPTVVEPTIMAQLFVPAGYRIDAGGVYRVTLNMEGETALNRVTHAPIFVAARTEDVLTGEAKRQIVWRGSSGWCSRIVDRRMILDTRYIMELANFDAPVSSAYVANLVSYLTEFEGENSHRYPAIYAASRMGWLPDGSFILPDQFVSAEEKNVLYALNAPPGLEIVQKGWLPGGTWENWLEAYSSVCEYPTMMAALYASACAPLLHILKIPGFVVDISGETSGGKTTALRFAASVWGVPAESYPSAMYSWDATKVWFERTAGFLHNLPLILDETKRAKNPTIVRDVIYDFCQGQGRGRGSIEGTQQTPTWRSVLISSGEGSATSFSQDAGTRARVIELVGRPLGNDAPTGGRLSEDLQILVSENYGHLGRQIIAYLVRNREHWDDIRSVFFEKREHYIALARGPVSRRHASNLAALGVAAGIVHRLGLPLPERDPFQYMLESLMDIDKDADRPLAALQDVVSWCGVNRTRFWGRHVTNSSGAIVIPSQGWVGAWSTDEYWKYVAVAGTSLKALLREFGYDPNEITSRWAERGWLQTGHGRNVSRPVRVETNQVRCYCIKRQAVELSMQDDGDS